MSGVGLIDVLAISQPRCGSFCSWLCYDFGNSGHPSSSVRQSQLLVQEAGRDSDTNAAGSLSQLGSWLFNNRSKHVPFLLLPNEEWCTNPAC